MFLVYEAFFLRVKGIESVVSGYSGGKVKNPTYREVTTGLTGHAEVVQIKFDPTVITYAEVLEIFWNTHDPYHAEQAGRGRRHTIPVGCVLPSRMHKRKPPKNTKLQLWINPGVFKNPIVTEITAFKEFYPAEDYHPELLRAKPQSGLLSVCYPAKN
jgi:peptide-methionine (S)-S-oxide reductase